MVTTPGHAELADDGPGAHRGRKEPLPYRRVVAVLRPPICAADAPAARPLPRDPRRGSRRWGSNWQRSDTAHRPNLRRANRLAEPNTPIWHGSSDRANKPTGEQIGGSVRADRRPAPVTQRE